jgi:hypothetical protein
MDSRRLNDLRDRSKETKYVYLCMIINNAFFSVVGVVDASKAAGNLSDVKLSSQMTEMSDDLRQMIDDLRHSTIHMRNEKMQEIQNTASCSCTECYRSYAIRRTCVPRRLPMREKVYCRSAVNAGKYALRASFLFRPLQRHSESESTTSLRNLQALNYLQKI